MCGIFTTTEVAAWSGLIPDVLRRLAHRGPDDSGWASPRQAVLLAHTRLAIIGLGAEGRQPTTSSDGSLHLVFNGEIYNYRELAVGLNLEEPLSDTRVLVEVLARRPASGLAQLRGMYAFAAWNESSGDLQAMRDPFGIKPLYVLRHQSGGVTLCSEIGPLLLLPEARAVDPLGIGEFLALGHTGSLSTVYLGIHKLVPGSLYTWSPDRGRGYTLQVRRPPQVPAARHADLKGVLTDSVMAHLTADVEVGCFLSSGVDSTLICALASERQRGMRAYTLSFPEAPAIDELEAAARNARVLRARHVLVEARTEAMAEAAVDLIRVHGEPLGDAAILPLSLLARRASEDVKVVLCGEGSDELFGGYARYALYPLLGRGWRLVRHALRPIAHSWGLERTDSRRARAIEAFLWGGGVMGHTALLAGEMPLLRAIHPQSYRSLVGLLRAEWDGGRLSGDPPLAAAVAYDRKIWLPNVFLEKTDQATMLWGLEARVPYLDGAVAAMADRGRAALRGKGPLKELLLRLAPGVQLPPRKLGLAVPIPMLVRRPPLRQALRFALYDHESTLAPWLGSGGRDLVVRRCRRSPPLAFRVAMLGLWQQTVPSRMTE